MIAAPTKGVFRAIRGGASAMLDLLLPETCGACAASEVATAGLCAPCARTLLSMVALPYCPRCGATIGPNIPVREDGCPGCPTVLPRFEMVVRLGPYANPLRSIIHELKYRRREEMLRRLMQLLAEAVIARTRGETFDLLMPVPMHWLRRLWRGFDHARALGGRLARQLDLPLGGELIRIRNTPPQVQFSRTKRKQNVSGAFALRSAAAIEGARVLLVDDVTTTGATANEATRTLLSGGAAKVTLAVVAKAEPPTAYTQHWV